MLPTCLHPTGQEPARPRDVVVRPPVEKARQRGWQSYTELCRVSIEV